ncbi:unnamed protein product [Boreogadus saida]
MGNCLSEMKLTKGGLLKNLPETDAGKEVERGPPADGLYAAVDFSKKRSSRAPRPPDSSPRPHDSSPHPSDSSPRPPDSSPGAPDSSPGAPDSSPGPPDSSPRPSECVYSLIIPHRAPAPPTSEAEEGADDYVLMQ